MEGIRSTYSRELALGSYCQNKEPLLVLCCDNC